MPTPANPNQGLLVIISGPSGVGKTTIAHEVERRLDGLFSVSMTTRPKTPADTEGKDYYFVDRARFEHARDHNQLLEWAEVFDNYYGTPRQPVEQALADGKLIILEIDVEGATQIKQHMPYAYGVFMLPPSEDELLQRLRDRKRDDEAVIQRRFAKAKREIDRAKSSGAYNDFVVNDDLDKAITQTIELIQKRRGQPPSRAGH